MIHIIYEKRKVDSGPISQIVVQNVVSNSGAHYVYTNTRLCPLAFTYTSPMFQVKSLDLYTDTHLAI